MTSPKRGSLLKAITRPLSILLFWQAFGWIAFGLLDPIISQDVSQPVNSGLELSVGIIMAILVSALGTVLLIYRTRVSQAEVVRKEESHHRCMNCGYPIMSGVAVCPRCGSKTYF